MNFKIFWIAFLLCGFPFFLSADNLPPRYNMSMLYLVSRQEWNALPPNFDAAQENGLYDAVTNPEGWMVYERPLNEVLKTVIVHHSALPVSDGPYEIQQLHFNQKGYADIAYHFVIDENGTIYEGRDIHVRGAHTGGYNTGSVGVVLLGNFELTEPAPAQLAALKKLLIVLKEEYRVTHLAGHRDFNPGKTVCPGGNLAESLTGLADELNYQYGTDGYVGP